MTRPAMRVFRRRRSERLLAKQLATDKRWRIEILAQFKDEVRRGIVHTPEKVAKMEREQAWFDEMIRGELR